VSDRNPDELSQDAEAAWHAFAGAIAPDDGAQTRVLQRVRERTKAPRRAAPLADVDEEDNGSQNARRAAAAVLVVKSSAISLSLAGGALLSIKLIAAAVQPTPVPHPPTVEIPEPPPVEHRAEAARPLAPTPAQSASPVTPALPPASPATSPPSGHHAAPAPAVASDEDRLRAEIDLVGQMRDALQAGEHVRALELIETHRRDFRDGSLIEEREAFHAIAACRNGDANGAALAQRFATSRPRSSQLAAVRAACNSAANESMDPPQQPQ
jgi:hypothetical protein